jgi:D-3-phosphoglycerate dehydrogenase
MKPLIIQTENLPQICSDWLAHRCDLHVCPADSLRFKELLPQAEALVIRTYTNVTKDMIEQAPKLKVIGRAGVGVDNIDLLACKERNVTVVHTPDANTESVIEFVLTTMLSKLRNLKTVDKSLTQTEWNTLRDSCVTPSEFSEITLGIIGFGRIGSRLGKLSNALGFNVVFHDLLQIENTHGCKQVELSQLLSTSNIISIHVDGRMENKHLCNSAMFEAMKPNILFMNTARGFIVDTQALADFLSHHAESNAILDVHDPEPITCDYPLLRVQNAELYPHIACKTVTATTNMGWVVRDIDAVLQGKPPLFEAKT